MSDRESMSGWAEMGVSGLKHYGGVVQEEWDPRLSGARFAKVVRELVDSNSVMAGFLLARSALMRQARWFVTRPNDKPEAKRFEEHANSCLADMERPWGSYLHEFLTFGWFGWSLNEIAYKIRRGPDQASPLLKSKYSDGLIGWRRFAPRAQESLHKWEFNEDGDVVAMWQLAAPDFRLRRIDLRRCVLFRPYAWKDNPEGRSMLRPAMRDWHYIKRHTETEAIGIARDLAGIMLARVPAKMLLKSATDEEKETYASIKTIVQRAGANEYQGMVYAAGEDESGKTGFDISVMQGAGTSRQSCDPVIRRLETRMLMGVLGQPLMEGQNDHGSYSLTAAHTNLMAMGMGSDMDSVCDDFDKPLADLAALTGCPPDCVGKLQHGDIEQPELTAMAAYVSQLVASRALTPDDKLERYLREYGNLPLADTATARLAAPPPAPEKTPPPPA